MPHRNAPLTETGRLRLARCVVEDGRPLRRAAERFQVSPTTAQRWADRYRALGETGMTDRSSRPHHSPPRTPSRTPGGRRPRHAGRPSRRHAGSTKEAENAGTSRAKQEGAGSEIRPLSRGFTP